MLLAAANNDGMHWNKFRCVNDGCDWLCMDVWEFGESVKKFWDFMFRLIWQKIDLGVEEKLNEFVF